MLTVPEEVKDLFHRDHCYKNIRIHFPNGERSDICNDLIVKDSVSFKESLCSQNTLKFGLCESSVFECETVGVGNIKKAIIEVSCEIECAATVEGAEWRVDLQKYVYPVPYGTFIVSEATRQADMIHRKITAYNVLSEYEFKFTDYEIYRSAYKNTAKTYFKQKLIPLISESMQANPFMCEPTEITGLETISNSGAEGTRRMFGEGYRNSQVIPWNEGTKGIIIRVYQLTAATSDELYRLDVDFTPQTDAEKKFYQTNPIKFAAFLKQTAKGSSTAFAPDNIGGLVCVKDCKTKSAESSHGRTVPIYSYTTTEFNYIYPYMSLYSGDTGSYYSTSNYQGYVIGVVVGYFDTGGVGQRIFINDSDIHLYKYTLTDDYSFNFTRKVVDFTPEMDSLYAVGDPQAIDLRGLFSGYLETKGLFGYLNRHNVFDVVNIKRQFHLVPENALYPNPDLYPEGVTGGKLLPNDYQTCWYEDDYTKPYGAIVCTYKNTANEDCSLTMYLEGFDEDSDPDTYLTYALVDNYMISNSLYTLAQITAICNSIAANISGVRYMPVDFVGRGLPYVEAGDTFEILTKSNDSITTIVLNRTITGEMTLTDSYKSV